MHRGSVRQGQQRQAPAQAARSRFRRQSGESAILYPGCLRPHLGGEAGAGIQLAPPYPGFVQENRHRKRRPQTVAQR